MYGWYSDGEIKCVVSSMSRRHYFEVFSVHEYLSIHYFNEAMDVFTVREYVRIHIYPLFYTGEALIIFLFFCF